MALFQIEGTPAIVTSEEFVDEEWIERGFWKRHEEDAKKKKDAFICFEFKEYMKIPKLDANRIHSIMNNGERGSRTPKIVKMADIIK